MDASALPSGLNARPSTPSLLPADGAPIMNLSAVSTDGVFCTGDAVEDGDGREGVDGSEIGAPDAGTHPTTRKINPISSTIRHDLVNNMVVSLTLRTQCWLIMLTLSTLQIDRIINEKRYFNQQQYLIIV
jgi:hypothetical protein